MLIPLVVFTLALAGAVVLALILGRLRGRSSPSVLPWAILGYILGGAAVWLITPPEWTLSFPQTLAASVDSRTYGHPVEHYAESLLVVMLVACVFGSLVLSVVATFRPGPQAR
jgi:hypothetical protein